MYNGVGVPTARGTATSGYVQKNLSALTSSKVRRDYDPEEDTLKAEAVINRKPNLELLEHEYKRAIELKCLEYEERMIQKGYKEKKVEKRVKKYRKRLARKLEKNRSSLDDKVDLRNTHTQTVVAKEGHDRLRKALGIHSSFVAGTSMATMNERKKRDEVKEEEEEPAPPRR